jgi:uncharacterized protein (TIGR03437 family)
MISNRATAILRAILAAGFLVFAAPLSAQFDHLVTNDDGDVLYFSSPLRMRGAQQFNHRKLFVADAQGIRLHTQREREEITVPESAWPVTTYYSIEAAALNGDGSVIGVIASRNCHGGSGCLIVPNYRTEISGETFQGGMSLSRNGRYALFLGDGSMGSSGMLVDLSTGQKRLVPDTLNVPPRYGRRRVTSGGTALVTAFREIWLVRLDSFSSVPVPELPLDAVIDDEGTAAVYEDVRTGSPERRLFHIDLGSGTVRLLAAAAVPMQPCLSNDGQVVLFVSNIEPDDLPQMFVMKADGTERRQLTADPTGISEVVLSGNGKVAFAVTGAGRLFRLDVESGAAEQIIGRTAMLDAPNPSIRPYPVAGSAFAVTGRGFADSVASAPLPLPLALNGMELLLDGLPLPLQMVAPTRIVFQLPWDVTLGEHRLEARTEGDPVFETEPVEIRIHREAIAQFADSGQPYALAAHHDFASLVTEENPARPSEIIHLYMTGLGPVEPAVEAGAPAPSNPPARILLPLSCHFLPGEPFAPERPAEVLFSGLAPGFAGYYQVTIRVPQEISIRNGSARVRCQFPGPGTGSVTSIPMFEEATPSTRIRIKYRTR